MKVSSLNVAVIGIGTMGAMAMWQLAEMGARVDGFEKFTVGHDFGAGGGGTRMFRMVYAEGAAYHELLKESRLLWGELAALAGHEIMIRNGAMVIASPASPQITQGIKMAEACQVPYELMDRRTVAALFPQHQLDVNEMALFDPMGGVIHTERGICAASKAAISRGASLHEFSNVTAIEPSENGVDITVNGIVRHYDKAVVCTGPWLNAINEKLNQKIFTRSAITTFHRPRDSRLLVANNYPSAIRRREGNTLATMNSLDNNTIKILLQVDDLADDIPADEAQRRVYSREFLQHIGKMVSEFLPSVDPNPVRIASYPEGFTADGQGVVGEFPGLENIVLMSGFSGAGFKVAPALGKAAAEIALTGETTLVPATMRPRNWEKYADELSALWFDVGNKEGMR